MQRTTASIGIAGLVLLIATTAMSAAPKQPGGLTVERALDMDYGPFLSTSVMHKPTSPLTGRKAPLPEAVALKGIAIRLYDAEGQQKASICFDTDRLCMGEGWTGGFLELAGTMLTNHKGTAYTTVVGSQVFRRDGIGWGGGANQEDFVDPRSLKLGPLPDAWGKYRGLYLHGNQVVLAYQVGGADVLELPGYEAGGFITRTIRIESSRSPLTLAICDVAGEAQVSGNRALITDADVTELVVVSSPPAGAQLRSTEGRLQLQIPTPDHPTSFKVAIWKGRSADVSAAEARLKSSPAPIDPKSLTLGGPARWTQPVTTVGNLNTQPPASTTFKKFPYALDTLEVPDKNPWNSWLRFTGLDFFPDGRAAVCTLNGDVWIISGIDAKLEKLTWKRYATGLYQPLGLKISGGDVYVLGRDQITRLHDLNGDGEADFYEDFNSGGIVHPMYNAFAMELQQGSDGSFYYARCGQLLPPNYPGYGYAFRVSSDGSVLQPIATGFRVANGMGTGPDDRVMASDNEGEWTPASRIDMLRMPRHGQPLDFFGFVPQSHRDQPPTSYDPPLCWIPHRIDTSSGGEAYIADNRWGPYQGQWVHTSYGSAALFLLLVDESAGRDPGKVQGAVIRFPFTFDTGIMRPRFNPADGQLFVAGIGGGWQTSGTHDGGLHRVRYTGTATPPFPSGFRIQPHGIQFSFPAPLDSTAAADDQNWSAEQWAYRWEAKYGSPDISAANPKKNGHDPVEIKSTKLSPDGKTITLEIPALAPVMQMMVQPSVKTADGIPVEWECYLTVNHVGP